MDPGGSRLPPAGRCPTVQKWHSEKRNLFRKVATQENCVLRMEFTAAGIRMTHGAKVARRRGHDRDTARTGYSSSVAYLPHK